MTATLSAPRYSSPGRHGVSRPLTAAETREWKEAVAHWHTSRPWTEQVLADNAKVRALLIRLYEDGVALNTLAAVAGWGYPQAAGVLRRAREEGLGTGSRRYIAPPPKPASPKQPFRRALTPTEAARLDALAADVPTHGNGTRDWKNPAAAALLGEIDRLAGSEVALDTLGTALGMSRQAVHQHLTRFRLQAGETR